MTGSASAEHAYFRRVEDTFIELRGAPFLLSPADWKLAQDWYERGIPVDLVCRALEDLFAQRIERGDSKKVQSLRYCASAVENAWSERQELGSAQPDGESYALDVGARLDRLAQALPAGLPGREGWVERVRAAGAGTKVAKDTEQRLAQLDQELIEACVAGLESTVRELLESEVEVSLSALSDRLSAEVLTADRRRLLRERARRHSGLPLLSLFAPDALER